MKELGSGPCCKGLQVRWGLRWHLDRCSLRAHGVQDTGAHRSCQTMNVCYFKSLSFGVIKQKITNYLGFRLIKMLSS